MKNRSVANVAKDNAPSINNDGVVERKHSPPTTGQWIISCVLMGAYVIFFILLVIAALISSKNLFLFASIPILAKELAFAFRTVIQFLLPREM